MQTIFSNTGDYKDKPLKEVSEKAEYEIIERVLQKVNFNKTKAAFILKIDRRTLYNKLKIFKNKGF
jgi:two-component system response regulator HydG